MSTTITCTYTATAVGVLPVAALVAQMALPPPGMSLPKFYGLILTSDVTGNVGQLVTRTITFRMTPTATATWIPTMQGASGQRLFVPNDDVLSLLPPTTPGAGYAAPPAISFVGDANTKAKAFALMRVDGAFQIAGGSGYTVATVKFSAGQLATSGDSGRPTATQATGHAVIIAGAISSVVVDTPGGPYNVPPTITILGDGTGAFFVASLQVSAIRVTSRGNGYIATPTVVFTPIFKVLMSDTRPATQASALKGGYMVNELQRSCKTKITQTVIVA